MNVDFPDAVQELFRPHRYKVLYGGRGCVDEDTLINTPSGNIKIKDFSGGLVYACDGETVRPVFACKPKKYKAENLYKVSTASYSIVVTANHRFLTDRGWVRACDLQIGQDCLSCVSQQSFSAVPALPLSTSGNNLSKSLQDVLHCLKIIQGWICRYWQDYRPDGEPPRLLSGNDLDVFPSQADERQHKNHALSRLDDRELAYINDLICRPLSLLQNLDVRQDAVGKSFVDRENYICDMFFELFSALHEAWLQFHMCNSPASITHKFALLVQAFYTRANQGESLQIVSELQSFFSLDSSFSSSFTGCNLAPHIITHEFVKSIEFVEKKYFYDVYVPIFNNYVGNGIINHNSAKSWSVARALLVQGCGKKLRILCVREIQHSISESVHRLLSDQIWAMGLNGFYEITKNAIVGANGTEFLFKGIKFNTEEIKSTEGVDICWVEEAEKVSAESWDILIPTIRKDNSEIIIVFNPDSEDSPTYQRFVVHPPKGAWVKKINYTDNPYFPDVLRQDMEWCKERDYEAYLNIWEGECRKHSNALIFAGRFKVEDFDTPLDARFYHGCDWGFSCLSGDTLITTDKGEKPIKDIVPGDMVLTRKGYKPVLHLLKRGFKDVYSLDYGGGKPLTVTGDHKIFTIDGWKRADELKEVETVCVVKKSNLTGEFTNDTRTGSTRTISIANGKAKGNIIAPYTIGTYGNITTGKSQKDTLSIMLTGTHLTTVLKTLSALHLINTPRFITKTIWGLSQKIKSWSIGKNTATQKRIGQSVERSQWQPHKNDMEYVKSAGSPSHSQTYIKNSAPHDAERKVIAEMPGENLPVKCAGQHLSLQVMTEERPVLTNAHIHLAPLNDKREVFDLTVEGEHEFFANGLLVHNCDPTTLIRCFIQDRTIFIDREAWGVGVDLDETPALFDTIDTARKWPIKADNARPETISFMKRRGFHISGAKKWAGSIEDGIEFLKAYDIVIHPRCRHTIDEFNNYSYKVDKQTNDVLPVIVDAWNHCIDAIRYSLDGVIKGRGAMKINPAALQMR